MPMYNLLKYSNNYSITAESFWNCHRDEENDNANENNAAGNEINQNKTITDKSFEYKIKLIGSILNYNNTLNTEVVVPSKYLSNFWRFSDLPLINCQIELDLLWSKKCIISEVSITPIVPVNPNANPPDPDVVATQTTGATFQVNNAKRYVSVVTLSIKDNIKHLANIK